MTELRRLFGVIKSFNQTFGFIEAQDGGSYFTHWRDLPFSWRSPCYRDQLAGKSVTFQVERRGGRENAARVFIIDEKDECRIGGEIEVCDVQQVSKFERE